MTPNEFRLIEELVKSINRLAKATEDKLEFEKSKDTKKKQ